MKYLLRTFHTFIFFLPISILSVGCIYMAVNEIDGWGWVLFVIVVLFGGARSTTNENKSGEL